MIDLSLLQDFITEANEHLDEMESCLLQLEKAPDDKEIMNDIFRAIHTIKGASQFVGLTRISELSHKMENLLDLLRQGEKELNQDITDTLIDTKDRLGQLTKELELNQEEGSEIEDLLERIVALSEGDYLGQEISTETPDEEQQKEPELASALEEALNTSILDGDLDTSILGDGLDTSMLDDSLTEDIPTQQDDEAPEDPAETTSEIINDDLIRNELAEEAHDEELFGIFIQQTKNNFEEIRELVPKLAGPDTVEESLDRCKTCLTKLRASANYMSYANLVSRYDIWQADLSAAKSRIEDGNEASFDFMNDHLEQIVQIIPQLADHETVSAGSKDAPEQGPAEEARPDITAIDGDAIRSEISEEIYDDELFDIFTQQVSTNIGAIRRGLAEFEKSGEKSNLFDCCDKSLTNLKSSANYMGYSNLLNLYEKWQADVAAAGQDGDINFINDYLDQMISFFPDLTETGLAGDSSDIFAEEKDTATAGETRGKEDQTGEDELFATLSSSVDTAMADVNESGVEPLHGILEEMLFADEIPAEPQEKPEKKKAAAKPKSVIEEPDQAPPEQPETERRQDERRQTERRQETGDRTYKQSIRVDSDKIDSLMNQVGELVVSRAYFAQIYNYLRDLQQVMKDEAGLDAKGLKPIRELAFKLGEATVGLGRVSNELQEGVMKVRMLPVAQLFNRYPRLVRDLIHKTDKKVDLVVRGEETELDKMVIEEISDPLIHIIRNAVDHGLETPKERKKAGKPKTGTLTLEAYHESNHIVIEITDDGRGIDIEKVKKKALDKGLISKQELSRISDAEARRFIMMPGFSTADTPTETSGRGVGMDVIKTNIEKLNGTVEVDSELGIQTRIRIKIPLTLAIIQALMVRVGEELFTIPLSVVEETLRIFEHDTSTIEGVEVIHLRDTTMPIFRLADIFGIEGASQDISQSFVVIVTTGMQEIGIVVDELIGQEEVVIKPLVDYLREESGFSGATIIGDGRISLILDIYELVKMTSEKQIERTRQHSLSRKSKTKVIKSKKGMGKTPSADAVDSSTIH
ncbi:MAG: chemotaxis protein CheA [Thermodesulfobacteriota bacterium]